MTLTDEEIQDAIIHGAVFSRDSTREILLEIQRLRRIEEAAVDLKSALICASAYTKKHNTGINEIIAEAIAAYRAAKEVCSQCGGGSPGTLEGTPGDYWCRDCIPEDGEA